MPLIGAISLVAAFGGCVISAVCLLVGHILLSKNQELSELISWGGRIATLLTLVGLTVGCGVLVVSFMTGNLSIQYVLDNHSNNTSSLAWLFKLSGLWAGRQGSLMFWAWLISLFGSVVALRRLNANDKLDNIAMLVIQLVLAAFVGVLLFSQSNMPFLASEAQFFNADGTLNAAGSMKGMNSLLEHWAMAIHPPTLFVGYAGLTVPFAYAIAAVVTNDTSVTWVNYCTRYTLVSWMFLSAGIGLGAVWAYVVLGWGGYWGWDPVENASLLSWLVCVALIHSFTAYRQKGSFKGWSIMFACLTFAFVIVGTFISRSGLVQSVHAFEGDPVSLILFLILIVASVLAGIVGCIVRKKSLASPQDDFESMFSRNGAYFVNSVFLLVMTCLLAYMTLSSALPTWLPFGGEAFSAGSYNALARPLGILYLLLMAVGPLMGWNKTDGRAFWRQMKIPALLAAVLFMALMAYFAMVLLPAYQDVLAQGGSNAELLQEQGSPWYYNGMAVVGFAVASLLFFNSLAMAKRSLKSLRVAKTDAQDEGENEVAAPAKGAGVSGKLKRFSLLGGSVSHAGMAIVLVGLIGSSMYVTESAGYMAYDAQQDVAFETYQVKDYELTFAGSNIEQLPSGDAVYTVDFDVTKGGVSLDSVHPSVQMTPMQQQKLNAAVISLPLEDLFVVYRGLGASNGGLSLDVRVNPLISFVWVGFLVLVVGTALSLVGRRRS